MPKRLLIITLASAATLSACGGSSGGAVSASAVAKCAGAAPETASTSAPTERQIASMTVHGGWLAQHGVSASPDAPEFALYVFKDDKTAEAAFALFQHPQDAEQEFGGGGTFMAKNVIVTTDQNPSGSLADYASTLLKKCVGSSASKSIYRSNESSTENTTEGTASEAPSQDTGEVGAPGQSEPSAGQSPVPDQGA